jgi:hypothetical protein
MFDATPPDRRTLKMSGHARAIILYSETCRARVDAADHSFEVKFSPPRYSYFTSWILLDL